MKFKCLFLSLSLMFGFSLLQAQDKKPDFDKMRENRKVLQESFKQEIFPSLQGQHEKLMASLSSEDQEKLVEIRAVLKDLKYGQKEALKQAKAEMDDNIDPIDKKERLYTIKAPYTARMKAVKENDLKPLMKRNEVAIKAAMTSLDPTMAKWKGIVQEVRGGDKMPQEGKKPAENPEKAKKQKGMKAAQFLLWDGTLESAEKMMMKRGKKKGNKKQNGKRGRG